MQWTIDVGKITDGSVSDTVGAKALRLFEDPTHPIVRTSRRGFRIPSWTRPPTTPARSCSRCRQVHPDNFYHQIITAEADHQAKTVTMKAVCDCDAVSWCHHGLAAALELRQLDFAGYRIVGPTPKPARRPPGRRPRRTLTLIPGDAA